MIAHSEWKGGTFFEGTTDNGNALIFDADPTHAQGPSPMEAVLMALCACTSVDVVSILEKKRQPFTGLKVTAHATRTENAPRVFTHIKLIYAVSGPVDHKAAEDAVTLSKNKYCSISLMLEKAAVIEYETVFADEEPES